MFWSATLLLTVVHLCLAKPLAPRWDNLAEKHSWADIPRGWEYLSPAPADMVFDLRVGLKQGKIEDLIENLMETSDPNHERYGKHLSQAEVDTLIAPHPESVNAVESWLDYHGIGAQHTNWSNDWVIVRVTVAQAERMLGAKYNVYHHSASSERVVRTLSYSLPRDLHSRVDVVAPTTYFATVRSMRATSFLQPNLKLTEGVSQATDISNGRVPASCGTKITLECLHTLYNTKGYVPTSTATNKIGVAGYLDEFANYADLEIFFQKFRKDAVGSNFTTIQVNGGGNDQNKPGVEANLDIQYTTGITFPTPNIYYSTGGSPPFKPDSQTPTNTNEPYLDWLNFIFNQTTIPQVISTSYGDDEQTVPRDYAIRVCNMFARLGSMGTTVFFSSGDFGVGGGDCQANDGTKQVRFQPSFPASCPFVTTVGGTVKVNPETAVDFSGGGFSNYFLQPPYQAKAVIPYLANLKLKNAGLFNIAGRAYPDLAAQGAGFQVVVNKTVVSVGGTSASAPAVAGVFTLLNDFRIANGKPSLGFINPLIYSRASGFNDIVSGSNPGCGSEGFTAVEGWDPVTGLGTPDFLKLKEML
ncbi:peptidase S8/S53 domain-containing protein [Collybia nuda]|uniref:tripeptidyl-peptidase II n=1 Tax=Collybia nuda TaxID=64659 RepID=A0A9P5XUT1_9AGAR|nr:peptidase S8/S53 domain-containing protein [Collybia nuda]